MTSYDLHCKKNPNWPKLIREVVGRRVQLKWQIETRGGVVFEKGEILKVCHVHKGKFVLDNGKEHPDRKSISKVHPSELELLRPESIVWRSKEAFLLFCISVAGKRGKSTKVRIEKFLEPCTREGWDKSPFEYVRELIKGGKLRLMFKKFGFGQYTKLTKAFTQVIDAGLDLDKCKTRDLEKIHGIGPKTSRYYILRVRPNAKVAALDTHILHWLRDLGHEGIPKNTPQSMNTYWRIEAIFLAEAKKRRCRPARLDAEIWHKYSGYIGTPSYDDSENEDEAIGFD